MDTRQSNLCHVSKQNSKLKARDPYRGKLEINHLEENKDENQ